MTDKQNLSQLPTTTSHDGTVSLKRLIKSQAKSGPVETMNYAWLDQGQEVQAHAHANGIEYYLILRGSGWLMLNKKWLEVKTQDWIVIKPGVIHSIKNDSKTRLEFITLRTAA